MEIESFFVYQSSAKDTQLANDRMIMSSILLREQTEIIMICFKVQSWY